MCIFAGMQRAIFRMIPVIDYVYRDRCAHFKKINCKNQEKAHLYY